VLQQRNVVLTAAVDRRQHSVEFQHLQQFRQKLPSYKMRQVCWW